VIGACFSICIVYLFRNIANLIMYKKILNINIKHFIVECYVKHSVPAILTIILGYIYNYYIRINTWLMFVVESLFIVFTYACISYLFDKKNFELLFKRK
jgi:hypothetical protein